MSVWYRLVPGVVLGEGDSPQEVGPSGGLWVTEGEPAQVTMGPRLTLSVSLTLKPSASPESQTTEQFVMDWKC